MQPTIGVSLALALVAIIGTLLPNWSTHILEEGRYWPRPPITTYLITCGRTCVRVSDPQHRRQTHYRHTCARLKGKYGSAYPCICYRSLPTRQLLGLFGGATSFVLNTNMPKYSMGNQWVGYNNLLCICHSTYLSLAMP